LSEGRVQGCWSLALLTTTIVYNHSLVPSLIGGDWVIDCGANRGDFSHWATEHTSAKVIAYEPDPRLFARLPPHDRVTYFNLALAAAEGEAELFLGDELCSSLVHAERGDAKVVRVKTVELERHLESCDVGIIGLLKLDIEGAELDVLPRLSPELLQRVKQITCEFHDFLDPTSLPKVREVIAHLERQEFFAISFARRNHGDVLFLNRRFVRLGLCEVAMLYATKYARGALRLTQRKWSSLAASRR
jgi:FkbM family methyltransferase